MAAQALPFKRLIRMMDETGDRVREALRKCPDDAHCEAEATFALDGEFWIDASGELQFGGRIEATGLAGAVPVDAGADTTLSRETRRKGAGTMRVRLRVRGWTEAKP